MLVVIAAGNAGGAGSFTPTLASVGTPGIAPSAIAVAATTNSHFWLSIAGGFAAIDSTNFNAVAPFSSRGPALGTAAIKPEIAAVGTDVFMAVQSYDSTGDLYNPLRYAPASGTSFSAPMVSGAAALVKHRHPDWQPGQIKSALVNTATQDLTDRNLAASVTAMGAGKLSAADAVGLNLSVNPQTASFGVIQALPATQTFEVQNHGDHAIDLQIVLQPRTNDARAAMSFDHSNLSIPPGANAAFTATLDGAMPLTGSYEGFIVLQADAVNLHIPYLYLASGGVPSNIIPLLGFGGIGLAGHDVPDGELAFQVIDQFGLPVPDVPVSFSVTSGGGKIAKADEATNVYGIATAEAIMGPAMSNNVFVATAAGMRTQFTDTGVLQPVISDNGVVNAASFQLGPGIAPGSYISIFGTNFGLNTASTTAARLPLSLLRTSVSFDVPEANLSVPGHPFYVSSRQVNVQVPWELRGQHSVRMKVSIENASGAVFDVPVADYSPGLFTYASGGQIFAVAQNAGFAAVTPDNPAIRGQTVTLYGTGFGPVTNPPASGDPASDSSAITLVTPDVTVGGVAAKVGFSGLAPGFAGLYQINVTIPQDAPAGMQPLHISANGIAANDVLLPIQ
jgi:uncharacterized protein (TIGR03437 family)